MTDELIGQNQNRCRKGQQKKKLMNSLRIYMLMLINVIVRIAKSVSLDGLDIFPKFMDQISKISEHKKPKAWKNGMDGKNTFLKKFLLFSYTLGFHFNVNYFYST